MRSYYDQYSSQYDNFYLPIQKEKFQNLKEFIRLSPILFDFGGGTGVLSEWIDLPIYNFDISYNMIKKGLTRRNYQGIAADLEHLPIRDGATSSFTSFTAIQNTESPIKALSEIQRVTSHVSTGVITFLAKAMIRSDIEDLFGHLSIQFEYIPFQGEDLCYLIRK